MFKHWPELTAGLGPALKELPAGTPDVMKGFGALAQGALAGTTVDAKRFWGPLSDGDRRSL